MKFSNQDLTLYLVTNQSWTANDSLVNQVEKSIVGGVTFIQLREKNLDDDNFLVLAKEIKKITDKYKIPFVINDNINIAIKANADGIHIGQNDLNVKECRKLIGSDKIIGVSVTNVTQAIDAENNGADYLGVGAMFATATKTDANIVSISELKEISDSVTIPVVAIGGIKKSNILKLNNTNICGVAIVSEILSSKDISKTSNELLKLSKLITKGEQV